MSHPTQMDFKEVDIKVEDAQAQVPVLSPTAHASASGAADDDSNLDVQGGTFKEAVKYKGPNVQKFSSFWNLFASGAAFVSDGYQNSLLITGNLVFSKIYGKAYSAEVATRVSNALLVGTILGQCSVGLITDRIGRKAAIILTTAFVVLGGTLGTVAHAPSPEGLFWFLTVARGTLGLGVGGEYPSTAASSMEAANQISMRKRSSAYLYSIQIPNVMGSVLTVCVFLFMLAVTGYKNGTTPAELQKLNITWRVEWAVGVILPLTVFYFRLKLLNSKLYHKNAIKRKVPVLLFFRCYWRRMIGVCACWGINQFIGSASSTFSALIIAAVLPTSTTKSRAEWQLLISALGIPAAIAGAFAADRMSRKLQLSIGFGNYVVMGIIIGASYHKLQHYPAGFFVLYALFVQLSSFGPGTLSGLLLAESYPTSMRGTAFGFTAAFGKVCGVAGNYAFAPITKNLGIAWVFYVGAILSVVAIILINIFVVDQRNKPMSVEDDYFRAYLRAHGYKGQIGEEPEAEPETPSVVEEGRSEKA